MDLLSLGAGLDLATICGENGLKDIIQIIGYILLVFKIAIPLLIIGLGVFDFGKAVVAEKEDEIKKQTKRLLFRVIAGIVIFLIPNMIIWIFTTFVDEYERQKGDFETCETCFLNPSEC